MPKVTKVVYKPDSQSTDEYTIIVNPVEYKKWKSGDRTIPLTDVVDSFNVFHSTQGSQGLLGRPSKQQLENLFGTSKDFDVVTFMLERGREQSGDGISSPGAFGGMNVTRGSAGLDRGRGSSGI